jgi:hypothetical protein
MSLCTARKTNGDPCPNYAMHGGTVCKSHGGRARQVKAAAAARLAERKALLILSRAGIAPVGDPVEALLMIASEALALKDKIGELIPKLDELRYQARSGEHIRGEILLYERAMDRAQKFLLDLAKLDLEGRQVAISERQAALLAQVTRAALADPELGLPAEQQEVALRVVARHLRLLAAQEERRP